MYDSDCKVPPLNTRLGVLTSDLTGCYRVTCYFFHYTNTTSTNTLSQIRTVSGWLLLVENTG